MKIYAINSMQSHSESVKKNVSLVGSIILRGFDANGDIQLLEGSHRMAHALELELPITIVLFNEDEIIPHDCDDIESPTTKLSDCATAGELANVLIKERGLYNQAVYESDDYSNINIIKPIEETGIICHSRLIKNSPFSAFPEKIWEVIFSEMKDVIGKNVLVLGKNIVAEAFIKLGAVVFFLDSTVHRNIVVDELKNKQYDLIYTTDIQPETDLNELFTSYKVILKSKGLAVTLNGSQPPDLITSNGLDIYAFLYIKDEYGIVSFIKQKDRL